MSVLKLNDNFFRMRKQLLADETTSDVIFRTERASFFGHSHLLLPHLELLSSLLCDSCRYSHEKIVIIFPDVESEFVEEGLVDFYLKGDITKLNLLFSVEDVKNPLFESKDSGSTEDSSTDMLNEECTTTIMKASYQPFIQQIEFKGVNDFECKEKRENEELTFAAVDCALDVPFKTEPDNVIDENEALFEQRDKLFPCNMREKVCQQKRI